jgi:hypothetical protein
VAISLGILWQRVSLRAAGKVSRLLVEFELI